MFAKKSSSRLMFITAMFIAVGAITANASWGSGFGLNLFTGNEAAGASSAMEPVVAMAPSAGCPIAVLPNNGGTSGNERAPNTNFRWGRSVYLVTAAELAAAGYTSGASPTSIGWTYVTGGGLAASAPLTVYMQNTADTTNTKSTTWTTAIAGMTTVHSGTTALPAAAGPVNVTFAGGTPFTYTGGGMYIAFDWGQYTGTVTTAAVVSCNTALVGGLKGAQNSTAAPATIAASDFRPETRLDGAAAVANDAAVSAVISYGEVPLGGVPAQVVKAVVTNNSNVALTNVPVTLNVTGADTFTNMQTIPTMASCGGQATVTFAGFVPGALGSDTVTVSVPSDDVPANNSKSKTLNITANDYSYKYPGSTADGGVGLTGATGAFVGKFTTNSARSVTDVKMEFFAASITTYRVAIYGDAAGVPSTTPIYVDAADRTVTVAGPVTINLPAPVAVPAGNFYVGIQQTNTTNASFSFDNEAPIRSSSFYFASPNPPTAFTDFAPGNNFKLNVGLILAPAVVPTGTPSPTATSTNTATSTPTATATCTPSNVIADGGFETGGIPSTIWNNPQTSTNFGTPLCDNAGCGTGGGASPPRTGLIWAWFGGSTTPETATLGQSVVIPSGTASLHFWMRIGTVTAPFSDVLNVRVDGAIVQSYPEPSVAEAAYTERVIDMTAFANGASHNVTFEYIGPGTTDTGSYVVDDVSLLLGSGCATPTGTPTSTATATNTPTATATSTPAAGSIAGTILYGNAIPAATRAVSNATVASTAGSPSVSTVTAAPGGTVGQYLLTGFGAGAYTITPDKTTGQNNITSFDAAKVAQHAAGTVLLTGNQLVVADVSANNSITSFDAGFIAKFVVSSPPFGVAGTWRFYTIPNVPFPPGATATSRSYASVTTALTGEDYTGLLMGEVSGNWNNTGARPAMGPERTAAVSAGRIVTPADAEVLVPVSVQGAANKGIISYEFDLRYDPAVIQPQANPVDLAGTVSSKLSVATNADEAGLLKVAVYGPMPISGNGLLMNLRFTAVGAPGSVSPLTWDKMMFNEGDPQTTVADGQVELSAAAANQAEISGRLLTAMGQGVSNARVTLTDTTGQSRSILSNGFGVYRFGGLQVGQTYTISVESRHYAFTPMTVSVVDQTASVDVIAAQ